MLDTLHELARASSASTLALISRFKSPGLIAVITCFALNHAHAQLEVQQLLAEDFAEDDHFGRSVAIDGGTIVVGAAQEDGEDGLGTVGAAYIFEPLAEEEPWQQLRKIAAGDALPGDRFGRAVAIDGDTIIVGAWGHPLATFIGAAYVFYRHEGGSNNWGEVAKLQASDGTTIDYFGISAAIDGDFIVVGASQAFGTGQAYIFQRNAAGPDAWGEVAILSPASATAGDQFGNAVAIDRDTIVVGARTDNGQGERSGAAYIYQRQHGGPGGWEEVAKLEASDGGPASSFGGAVAIEGDRVIVGCRDLETSGGCNAVYIFERHAGGEDAWGEVARLSTPEATGSDGFGWSVSLRQDVVIVGAPHEDSTAPDAGAAYVFWRRFGGDSGWQQLGRASVADAAEGDRLGSTVSVSGNWSVLGSYGHDVEGQLDAGAAYLISGVCPCPADLDDDGTVGLSDLLFFLAAWGDCEGECSADVDGSGEVGFGDLLEALAFWGECPCS